MLIAELIVGELARRLDLPMPELALVEISSRFGRSEPDPEIQELLRRSHGTNVGLRYLDGAFNFDTSAAGDFISQELAARIVWLDAFTTNPDRTARNPNLLIWQRQPWLIDHGAALYAHHDWKAVDEKRVRTSFPLIRSHVLLKESGDLDAVDRASAALLQGGVIRDVIASVPDSLLVDPQSGTDDLASPAEVRARYEWYLATRLAYRHAFVAEAIAAKEQVRQEPPLPLNARR
jgi:hypothetical protein